MSDFKDVEDMHIKYDFDHMRSLMRRDIMIPTFLTPEDVDFRVKFMREELEEYSQAVDEADIFKALDALVDLVVVAYGTAIMQGVSPELWQMMWDEVHRANMSKVRGITDRGVKNDLVKPPGWMPPNHEGVIREWALNESLPTEVRERVIDGWTRVGQLLNDCQREDACVMSVKCRDKSGAVVGIVIVGVKDGIEMLEGVIE